MIMKKNSKVLVVAICCFLSVIIFVTISSAKTQKRLPIKLVNTAINYLKPKIKEVKLLHDIKYYSTKIDSNSVLLRSNLCILRQQQKVLACKIIDNDTTQHKTEIVYGK